MSTKVSVIVALYNTGAYLRELLGSLDTQTMSGADFEVVLVDDGSTDDTLHRARELAAERSNVVVQTIPNSGWPGRPRNVGTDLAHGDYVFFSDHDDRFGPRALELMYQSAVANGSDIVYGKIVRTGRSTPYWPVWREDVAHAAVTGPVLTSRTVHKLYRRAFLVEHDIRFREGRVRLEDHEFMAQALPRARNVSVVASEPCYWWIHRRDGSNSSDSPVQLSEYWRHYAYVLSTWARVAGPGELLDAARVVSVTQAFSRFSAHAYLSRPAERRQALFDAVHEVIAEHFPPELDRRLPVLKRLRVQALRAGDIERFEQFQRLRQTISLHLEVDEMAAKGQRLRIGVTACCREAASGKTLVLEDRDGAWCFPGLDKYGVSVEDRTVLAEELGDVEVTVRHRTLGIEWPVAGQSITRAARGVLSIKVDVDLDLTRTCFGTGFEPGLWDVLLRSRFLGEARIRRLPAPESALPTEPAQATAGVGVPYPTARGEVAFKVAGRPSVPPVTPPGPPNRSSVGTANTPSTLRRAWRRARRLARRARFHR